MNVYVVESFEREFDYDGRHSIGVPCENYPLHSGTVFMHLVALPPERLATLVPHRSARNEHSRLALDPDSVWFFQFGDAAKAHWPGIRHLRNRGIAGRPIPLFEVAA